MPNVAAARRGLAGWSAAVLAVAIVVSIGTPLLGLTSFHASDVLQVVAPWSHDAPHAFAPQNGHVTDTVDAVMPARIEFTQRVLGDGEFPLWNPWVAAGAPLGSLPNASTLLPFTWLYLLLPAWAAPGVAKLLEMVVAAGATALFGRRLGLGWPAALLAGLVYVNTGFQVVFTNWPQSQLGALVPALFWAVERALPGGALEGTVAGTRRWGRRRGEERVRGVGGLWPIAVVSALTWLAGFPAVALWAHVAVGGYALVRLVGAGWRRRRHRRTAPSDEDGRTDGRVDASHRTPPVPAPPGGVVGRLVGLPAVVLLGLGLAALQVLPFALRLPQMDIGYREAKDVGALPWETAVTLVVPNAYGTPAGGGFYGPIHYVEIQSFVGAVALLLAVVALVAWRGSPVRPEARAFLWVAAAVCALLIFVGGPLLDLHDAIPVIGSNQIGRLRSLLGLVVAVLAGVGLQALADGAVRWLALLLVLWAGAVAGAGALLAPALTAAAEAGQSDLLLQRVVTTGVIAAIALGVMALTVLASRGAPRLATGLLAAIPVLVAVESVAFAAPFWPRIEPERFYPETPAHATLREEVGHDRLALAGNALYPGTNPVYDLRSATAHTLTSAAYADLLLAIDPSAFDRSRTFPFLGASEEVATSPLLDRMGAAIYVAPPEEPVIGPREEVTAAEQVTDLRARDTLETELVSPGPLRALSVEVEEPRATGAAVWLAASIHRDDGTTIAEGRRRVDTRQADDGRFDIALAPAEDDWPQGGGTWTARIRVETVDGMVRVATAGEGEPALSVVTETDDGLELLGAQGVVAYRRLDALPRIRWASQVEVVDDEQERVERLASGELDPQTVVLSGSPASAATGDDPATGGVGAAVTIVEDGGDRIVLDVDVDEDGWLVVADALRDGWVAEVDGASAPIEEADHAFGAVAVPAGSHEVELAYRPAGWDLGRVVSLVSVVLLVALAAGESRRRRADR